MEAIESSLSIVLAAGYVSQGSKAIMMPSKSFRFLFGLILQSEAFLKAVITERES